MCRNSCSSVTIISSGRQLTYVLILISRLSQSVTRRMLPRNPGVWLSSKVTVSSLSMGIVLSSGFRGGLLLAAEQLLAVGPELSLGIDMAVERLAGDP